MQTTFGSTRPGNRATDVLALAIFGKGGRRSAAWKAVNTAAGGGLDALLKLQGWKGKPGSTVVVPAPRGLKARLLAVTSLGERSGDHVASLRTFGQTLGKTLRERDLHRVSFYLDPAMDSRTELSEAAARALGEGLEFGAYRFDRHLAEERRKDGNGHADEVFVYFSGRKQRDELTAALQQGATVVRNENLARDLVNEPANILYPATLVDFVRQPADEKGLEIEVYDRAACEERGMGAFLAVARGSAKEPYLVHLAYKPQGAKKRVVMIGKALTYDAGGLCLKTPAGQLIMKIDMGGSAAVIGTLGAVADLNLDVELHVVFAACENMLGADAFRAGDVLTAANGKTIEIINTDAEGRLTLADALHFGAQLEPDYLLDVATLTGAAMVALGNDYAAIMGTSRGLLRDLRAAGDAAGELMWELPMPDSYKEQIQGKISDVKNLGTRYGGAITAGMFLREFVPEGVAWAHIDIAGPAFVESASGDRMPGATGFPVRALTGWLATL